MSRNLRKKTSDWIVIDETGSEGDDSPTKDDDSDYEIACRSSKVTAKKKAKDKDKAIAADQDKANRKARTNYKDEAINSRTNVTKTRKTGLNSKTDIKGEEKSSKTDLALLTKNEIIIDDENHEDIKLEASVTVQNRKRKGLMETVATKKVKTTGKSSSKKKLDIGEAGERVDEDEKEDSDSVSVVECRLSRKTKRKDESEIPVIRFDKLNRKASIKERYVKENSNAAMKEVRAKGFNSKDDIREEQRSSNTEFTLLSRNEITIDDEDSVDMELETNVPVKNAKKAKIVQASSSKKKLEIAERVELKSTKFNADEKEDSDFDVKYHFSGKTEKKIPVTDFDKSNREATTKDKDHRANTGTAAIEVKKKEFNSKGDVRHEERLLKTNVTSLSKNEIIIDDDDDEKIQLETSDTIKPAKKKEGLAKIAAVKGTKTTQASSSKQNLASDKANQNVFVVDSASDKLSEDEYEDPDYIDGYHSSKKIEKKDRNKMPVVDFDKSNHKANIKDKDLRVNTSTVVIEEKKEKFNSKADLRKEERLSENYSRNQIIINDDDDEDIQLETRVPIKRAKIKEGLTDTVAVKGIKTTQASLSKQNLAIDKSRKNIFIVDSASDKLSEDENEDSDYVLNYQSSMEAGIKNKDKVPVTGFDKPNHKTSSKDKGVTTCRNIEVRKKRFNSQADARKEEGSSDTDAKLLSRNEITIDGEDSEDIELKTEVPVKNTKRKGSNETTAAKKAKTVGAPPSKKKLKIDQGDKNLSAVEAENNKPNKNKKEDFNSKADVEWSESDYLSEFNQIDPQIAENLISLFKTDNTIPFIARYRKEMTGGMEPEQLRNVKNTYDNLKLIKQRALLILKTIDKLGKWSPELHSAVTAAKTLNELELIYAPFKPGTKRSLAERAKELGLASIGESILQGRLIPSLSSLIDEKREGLRNENDVKQGIVHIIADIISKDKTTFEGIRMLRKTAVINIESTKSKAASSSKTSTSGKHNNDHKKYENYFNFVSSERFIKDYQILAINRGESQKILSVKIVIPNWFERNLKTHCLQKYNFVMRVSDFHYNILDESFNDAYNRLIKPLVCRQVRHDLNERAESASIEVFARNLKKLLLIPPVRGKTVLGIDPGFSHGCKLAVISQCGNVLDTATIYPHTSSRSNSEQHIQLLANLIKKHSCTVVALGNATACRETEMFLTDLIQSGVFAPLDVSYTIVNEAGASIYSCGSEAKSEFPNLDPNIISAISIARRLQDPLAELIKVEPQHLGIGMYQHDLPKKQLHLTLDEVITETVSFVGVDINTASHCLLRRVAGLSATRAANIITRRNETGPFSNRQEILEVKGIGKKFFVQCAGFIRILPETAMTGNRLSSKKFPLDYLDQTWIHPESYDVARRFLKVCQCDLHELGTENFVQKVLSYANGNRKIIAEQFGTSEQSMDIIIKGLSMKKGEDIRVKEDAPLFRRNLRCIDDLCVNTKLTGSVTNVTNFGTFVDIGVGPAGLIPAGKIKGRELSLGQRVEVVVFSVDKDRGRISLSF